MARLPTIISFYCGAKYYYDCGEQLAADCRRLNLPHDIEELHVSPDTDWSQICREKVRFYERKLQEHGGPVLWVDVDCRILRTPRVLEDCRLDLMGFTRLFRELRDYDPYETVRFWVPGVLFLNNTPSMREFVALMNHIEQSTTERITDDYCLHEAWLTYKGQLAVGFFTPQSVALTMAAKTPDTVFVYGDSGNVNAYQGMVRQHEARDLMSTPAVANRIKALHDTPVVRAHALAACASDILRSGDRATACKIMRRAVALDPVAPVLTQHYAEILSASGEPEKAIAVLRTFVREHPDVGEVRRALARLALAAGRFELVRAQIEALEAHAEEKWRDYARSASFDLDLEVRAARLGLEPSERIGLWWMKSPFPGNFGDSLSPYVVEKVSGKPPRLAPRGKGVLAIGSIIKFAGKESQVWGSGTARMEDQLAADARYLAVRGPLTREAVLRSGGTCPEIYGDPGLLLPRLYDPKPTGERHAVGLICHMRHRDHSVPLDGVKEISIARVGYAELEAFIDEVSACDAVLSTSLHGLMTAHAYGIPARWCTFGLATAIPGDGTKFEDYYRAVGLRSQQPLDLSPIKVLDESLAREIDDDVALKLNADDLLAAFPH